MKSFFRMTKSNDGYAIELFCGGAPYLTYVDGLSKAAAERELQILTALWNGTSSVPRSESMDFEDIYTCQ